MANGAGTGGSGGNPKEAAELNSILQQQVVIMNQLKEAIASMNVELQEFCEASDKCFSGNKWKEITKQAQGYSDQTKKTTQNTSQLAQKAKELTNSFGKMAPAVGGVVGGLAGLRQGFQGLFALLKSGVGILNTTAKSLINVGRAILTIPFKLLQGLQDMANAGGGGGGGSNGMAEAMEELRKEFGMIGPTSSTIIELNKNMKGLADTGLNTRQMFGTLAEQMKYLTGLAKEMGPQFALNAEEFKNNGGALVAYQKGLGLTGEQMAAIAIKGKSMGKDMGTVLNDMTKQALHMAKTFGLDAKVISKDMGKAMQDVSHFGHLTTQQLGAAVVYANKLGVSIDKLTGLMDQFDTFDKAAESTSKLNEQFGTNIDAMELMAAQSPAEKMELLRKSFQATGKDMSQLTFQERKLIQQNTGLDQATFDAAMAAGDQGDMLENINKESKKAEDSTLKQADAMKELAKQIERVVQSGGGGGGGGGGSSFLDSFIRGFTEGITSSKEFQMVLLNLKQSMRLVGKLGFDLGRMFVEAFPGVSKILNSLAELFDPKRFKILTGGVLGAFTDFKNGSIKTVGGLMDRLKSVFEGFFGGAAGPGKKLLEGVKEFFSGIIKGISGLAMWMADQLAEMIKNFTKKLQDPKSFSGGPGGGFFKMFEPLLDALKYVFDKLWPLIPPLLTELGKKLFEFLSSPKFLGFLKDYGPKIALVLFGPTLLKAGIGMLTGSLTKAATSAISSAFLGGGGKKIAEMSAGEFSKLMSGAASGTEGATAGFFGKVESSFGSAATKLESKLGPKLFKAFKFAGIAAVVVDAGINVSESIEKFGGDLEKKGFDPATAKIAAGTQGLINTLTFGLLPTGLQSKLAEIFAKMYTMIFTALDSAFGPGFSGGIKKFFAAQFEIFAGIGDLAMALWNGDSQKANAAFKRIGKAIFDSLMGAIETSVNILLKIGPLILEYLFKGLGYVSSKIGDIFLALKDIPVVGFVFEWVGNAFKMLGDLFTMAGKGWEKIAEIMKAANITEMLRSWGQAVLDFVTAVWDGFKKVVDFITLPMRLVYALVSNIFLAIWQEVISPVIGWIGDKISKAYEAIKSGLTALQQFFAQVWDAIYNGVIKPIFEKIWSFIEPVLTAISSAVSKVWDAFKAAFNFIWEHVSSFVGKFLEWGHRILDILTEPGVKAKDRLVNAFNEIWTGITSILSWEKFKELGGKIIDGLIGGIGAVGDKIKEKFSGAIDSVKSFLGIRSPSQVFSNMGTNMIDGMMQPFTEMPAKLREKFANVLKDVTGIFDDMNKMIMNAVKGFLKTLTDAFTKIIDGPITEFPKAIQKAVEKILPVVDKIFADVLESVKRNFDKAYELISHIVGKILDFLNTNVPKFLKVFENFKDGIIRLFAGDTFLKIFENVVAGIKNAFGKLADSGPFAAVIAIAKKVFQISSPSKIFEKIGDNINDGMTNALDKLPKETQKTFDQITKQAQDVPKNLPKGQDAIGPSAASKAPANPVSTSELEAAMAGASKMSEVTGILKSVVVAMKDLKQTMSGASIKDFVNMVQDNERNAQMLKLSLGKLGKSFDGLADPQSSLAIIQEKISKFSGAALTNSFKDLQNIAKAVKELDDALASIGKIDLKQRIAQVAGRAGLDGGGVYTVKSKDVNITIALSVTMEAGGIEKVIISNNESQIKKAIKFLADNVPKDADDIKDTYATGRAANLAAFGG